MGIPGRPACKVSRIESTASLCEVTRTGTSIARPSAAQERAMVLAVFSPEYERYIGRKRFSETNTVQNSYKNVKEFGV